MSNAATFRRGGWPSALSDYALWSEAAAEKIRQLHADGFKIVILGNRAAVKGAFHGKNSQKTQQLANWLAWRVGVPMHAVYATRKDGPHYKPATGMWDAMEGNTNLGQPANLADSFFVGDMAGRDGDQGNSDRRFAENVGAARGGTLRFYLSLIHI